jgi:hypothetical protein
MFFWHTIDLLFDTKEIREITFCLFNILHNFRVDFLKILLQNLKAMKKIRFSPKAIYFPFRTVTINVKFFVIHTFALENF